MTDRESQVLAAMRSWGKFGIQPAVLTRLLNLDGLILTPREWCPCSRNPNGKRCLVAPRSSVDRVRRVLTSLIRQGKVCRESHGRRMFYRLMESEVNAETTT